MSKKALSIYILVVLATIVVAIEIMLRLLMPQPHLSFQHYYPEGVVGLKPNFNGEISGTPKDKQIEGRLLKSYRVPLQTNSKGFLGKKEFTNKKNGKRVISLGGSVSMAWPFGVEYSYGTYLEKNMPHVEVIQAPQIGTSLAHMYEHYLKISSQYEADILLVQSRPSVMNVDDLVQDTMGMDAFEYSVAKNKTFSNQLDIAGNPTLEMTKDIYHDLNDKLYLGSKRFFWLYEISHFARILLNNKNPDGFFKEYLNRVAERRRAPNKSLAYLKGLNDLAQNQRTKLIYLIIPNRYGCTSAVVGSWNNFINQIKKANINYISFFEDLCDLKNFKPLDSEFLSDEFHPTKSAYNTIAEKIYIHLKGISSD